MASAAACSVHAGDHLACSEWNQTRREWVVKLCFRVQECY
jgi:hypothetical protein